MIISLCIRIYHYEIFLIIKLVHLTCRKDRVQSPIRKEGWEGWDLFRRTSDDNSRFTLIIQNEEWWLECDIEKWREVLSVFHMDLQDPTYRTWQHHGIQGKIHSTRLLTERMHRICRDICSHWKSKHMTVRIMCANERRPCMSSEDTHGITHTWGAWWRY